MDILYIYLVYPKKRSQMKTYIAKIKDHQSIIYMARDAKDAIEWAKALKREMYGEKSELVSIWDHDDNKQVEV